jgi:predicted DNA-binding transcriptional regulator YafY
MITRRKRTPRIIRTVQLLQRLSSGGDGRATGSLCRELKISRRTFFRDLGTLRSAGIPVVYDARLREFCIDSSVDLAHLTDGPLTWYDAMVLLVMLNAADCSGHRELKEYRNSLHARLVNRLHQHDGHEMGSIASTKVPAENPAASSRTMRDSVLSARSQKQSTHRSRGV